MKFLPEFYRRAKLGRTTWIVKPGEISNRGNGITVCQNLQDIKNVLRKGNKSGYHQNGVKKTFLIQEYIMKPLLYKGRKFDLRHYLMITSTQGQIRGYFYKHGYVRTTSFKYDAKNNSPYVHLTNDAVQRNCKEYGKY